jgi:serine/threonine protein kinase/formylglycine-generating enzyme required for sulfatase activity
MNTAIDWNLMTNATIGNSAYQSLSNRQLSEIDGCCDRFDLELVTGDCPRIESFLAEAAEVARDGLLAELLAMELEYRTRQGETPRQEEYAQRFPQQAGVIAGVFLGVKIATSAEAPTQSVLSHPPAQTATGETIGALNTIINVGNQLGPYKLLAKLGEGGMGVVYQARHTKLGKLVALKILPQHLLSRSDALSRFEREMLAVGSLQHPNIIQALDAGEINGAHYLSMEYVEGQDLQQSVQTKGTMSVVDACKAILQAAQGLAAAHELGVVHRDIKPSNLFVTKQTGQIKILDMGLALLARAEKPAALTFNGQCFGTPDYMAPEQWNDAHTCDARSDLYSLGCTLYFLLVGRPPYQSEIYPSSANKMKGHMLDAIPDLALARPDVPAGVVAIYLKLMAKVPSERFATGDELATALAPWAEALPAPSAPAVAPTEPVVRPSSPNRSESSDKLNMSPPAALAAPQIQAVATPLAGPGSPPHRPLSRWLLAAGGAAAFVMLGVIIITITNKDGTKTRIEVPDTSQVEVTKQGDNAPATANPGWDGWPADAPAPAIAPFSVEQARQYQAAWAAHSKLPVEFTNTIGMRFRLIPPGEFQMGSTPEEIEAELKRPELDLHLHFWRTPIEGEGPQHKVVLTKPIYVGVTEVTQAQYELVMGTNPSQFSSTGEGKEAVANMETGNYPVEMVSFNESVEFCARLSQHEHLGPFNVLSDQTVTTLEGAGYRLPTEAEWEFACRAGTTSRFWSGDENEDLIQAGWCSCNAGGRTHAVGELKANPFGLSDMHGNVWEWVQDGCDPKFYGQFQEKVATDPFSPLSAGTMPMRRGGSFMQVPELVRSSSRLLYHTDNEMGFRVVLVVQGLLVSDPGDSSQSNDQSQSDVPANTQATPDPAP